MSILLEWTAQAERQLDEIDERIARDPPINAERFIRRIFDAAESLRTFPRRGRLVAETGRDDIHEIYIGRYRLLYRVIDDGNHVRILACIHASRLLSALIHSLDLDA